MSDYVEGDINTIDDSDDDEADDLENEAFDDEADDGEFDDDDDDADANGGEGADDRAIEPANRAAGSLPEKVLVYLARSLTRDPDAVVVDAEEHGGKVRLSLHVGPGDMGRVIGRRGRTAQAIRALVSVAGARSGQGTNVDIVDD